MFFTMLWHFLEGSVGSNCVLSHYWKQLLTTYMNTVVCHQLIICAESMTWRLLSRFAAGLKAASVPQDQSAGPVQSDREGVWEPLHREPGMWVSTTVFHLFSWEHPQLSPWLLEKPSGTHLVWMWTILSTSCIQLWNIWICSRRDFLFQ